MKNFKQVFFTLALALFSTAAFAQVKVGDNPTTIDASSLLELESTNKGFLLPRMTQAQRDAIASPAQGLVIYNTTAACIQINTGTPATPDWKCISVGGPAVPTAILSCASGTPSPATFQPNGTAYTGTVTLSYSAGNGGSYPAGSVASTGVTGFTATWPAGTVTGIGSIPISITGSSTTGGAAYFPIVIAGTSCTIVLGSCGAYINGVFTELLCHNLGADITLNPHIPVVGLQGAYIQWGKRGPTGDSRITWQTAANNPSGGFAAAPTASNSNAGPIIGFSGTYAAETAWLDASKTANDPCPTGYRIPTSTQWQGLLSDPLNIITRTGTFTQGPTQYTSAVHYGPDASTKLLTLPASGRHQGNIINRGSVASYQSSTSLGVFNHWLYEATSSTAEVTNLSKTYAYPVRCIKQ